jgi:hypothetical protein
MQIIGGENKNRLTKYELLVDFVELLVLYSTFFLSLHPNG